ncbi:MAG: hypothetical protein IPK60_07985 [Sandaracinaceae bacterium]|nr:hypothetical protein [Sandaracinaceae bacterium]
MTRSFFSRAALSLMVTLFAAACSNDEPMVGVDGGPPDLGPPITDMNVADRAAPMDLGFDMALVDFGRDLSEVDAAEDPCHGACAAFETCCVEGLLGHCESLEDGGVCPMPDLSVVPETVMSTLSVQWEYIEPGDCSIVEGCVAAPGWRRLMRFATQTPNIGNADMRIGMPSLDDPHFEYSTCHRHYHFVGYADYQLNNGEGVEVGHGHKQAFCLLDSERYVDDPAVSRSQRYTCDDQGIQAGWSDVYTANLDCQWVDVTDVAPGEYSLRVSINYERIIAESNFDNNVADVPVVIPVDEAITPLEPCSESREGLGRECGWVVASNGACVAGTTLQVGCGARCDLGTCSGDPIMRVCAGSAACGAREALRWDDDTCGRQCPSTSFTCPESGTYTVMTAPYRSADSYSCIVASNSTP